MKVDTEDQFETSTYMLSSVFICLLLRILQNFWLL